MTRISWYLEQPSLEEALKRTEKPTLCYVTDRQGLQIEAGGSREAVLLERICCAVTAGVDWIQLREKDLEARRLFRLASAAIAASRAAGSGGTGTRILINDRLDVAWAVGAAGVHLGEASLPVTEAVRSKRLAGRPDCLVGASCHSLGAALHAAGEGADYIFFGPVFSTPSKAGFGPAQGLERLSETCRSVRIPVLAIGGITAANAAACLDAGAAGIAGIRLFQQAGGLSKLGPALR